MKRHNDLPAGWRQPPETTAEPVPLRRPYVPPGEVFPPAYLMPPPPPRSQFLPRRQTASPARTPEGATPPPPQSQFLPRRQTASPARTPEGATPPPPQSQFLPRRRPASPGRTPAGATPPPPPTPLPPMPPPAMRRRPASPGRTPAGATPPPPPMPPPAMRQWRPMRAIIGDEFRKPVLWCEFGSCTGRYTSQDALGERDLRARALAAGWSHDAVGRLACPSCVQRDPAFLVHRPPAWADRDPWRR